MNFLQLENQPLLFRLRNSLSKKTSESILDCELRDALESLIYAIPPKMRPELERNLHQQHLYNQSLQGKRVENKVRPSTLPIE